MDQDKLSGVAVRKLLAVRRLDLAERGYRAATLPIPIADVSTQEGLPVDANRRLFRSSR